MPEAMTIFPKRLKGLYFTWLQEVAQVNSHHFNHPLRNTDDYYFFDVLIGHLNWNMKHYIYCMHICSYFCAYVSSICNSEYTFPHEQLLQIHTCKQLGLVYIKYFTKERKWNEKEKMNCKYILKHPSVSTVIWINTSVVIICVKWKRWLIHPWDRLHGNRHALTWRNRVIQATRASAWSLSGSN